MTDAPQQTAVNPTWTWGSSAAITLSRQLGVSSSQQLAQIQLPEPAVCSLYFQVTMVRNTDPSNISVQTFVINLSQGLGRVTIPRQIAFDSQPSDLGPLEFTIPFLPMHALQVDCTAFMQTLDPNTAGEIGLQIYLVVSPITRIPQKIQKLQFGMALPGEADAMDDELRENLEAESPTVAEIMGQEADQRVHGEEPPEQDEVEQAPAWMMDLVDRLTQRLGRAPTRAELGRAVQRVQDRQQRRARRG
jgi:hypothetical protein